MSKKINKSRPIKLKSEYDYQCPICFTKLKGSYQKAMKHVKIPVEEILPAGLVLKNGGFYNLFVDNEFLNEYHLDTYIDSSHKTEQYYYSCSRITYLDFLNPNKTFFSEATERRIAAREIKQGLEGSSWIILSEKEFELFKKTLINSGSRISYSGKLEKLIGQGKILRTCPEVERLVKKKG